VAHCSTPLNLLLAFFLSRNSLPLVLYRPMVPHDTLHHPHSPFLFLPSLLEILSFHDRLMFTSTLHVEPMRSSETLANHLRDNNYFSVVRISNLRPLCGDAIYILRHAGVQFNFMSTDCGKWVASYATCYVGLLETTLHRISPPPTCPWGLDWTKSRSKFVLTI
jgi:hypothetical protein